MGPGLECVCALCECWVCGVFYVVLFSASVCVCCALCVVIVFNAGLCLPTMEGALGCLP